MCAGPDYPDFAGYRACVIVEMFDASFLDSLSTERWSNLAPSILGFPVSSGVEREADVRQRRLAASAYANAPSRMIESVLTLIERENADEKRQHLFHLRRIEQCWGDQMLEALLAKAMDGSLKPSCLGDLLSELVGRGSAAALAYAKSLIPSRKDDVSTEVAKQAAIVIWLNADDRGWDDLWPEVARDRAFFRHVITDVAHGHRQSRKPPTELTEHQLADLYMLLLEEFRPDSDPEHDGAHWVGPREHVQSYRDGVLSALTSRGTVAACAAIERVRARFPDLEVLSWALRAARRAMLQATWIPLSVKQMRELLNRSATRLVRNGRELQQVIVESLGRLQMRLHGETPAVRDVWDKTDADTWKPIDENAFSDYLKRHLESDLPKCGIIALREVEIRRGYEAKGERTDVYVAATILGSILEAAETVRVIVEVKGCWNAGLMTDMESQLKMRYLKDNDCEHGIYVVGWFVCDSWTSSDPRRAKTPKVTVAEAEQVLADQARSLSDAEKVLEALVIDASLK